MVSWMGKKLVEKGYLAPRYHTISHPRGCEAEAFNRLITFAELIDQPIMIFHVSTAEGAAVIREARGRGVKVFAETCPHYLILTAEDVDLPGLEGAKRMFSPPARAASDHGALWRALALGDLQVVSSDHAPFRFDETGKLRAGPSATFKQIGNGMPGLESRLPLMFDAMVSQGRPEFSGRGLEAFVNLTATQPASIYNLPGKGQIAPGFDADIAIWDPQKSVTITDALMHDLTGYTPFAGRTVKGWPETVLVRGREVVSKGALAGRPGEGRWMKRTGGWAAEPTGKLTSDMDPARNFGAKVL
jgi:dihydropyrimidinase